VTWWGDLVDFGTDIAGDVGEFIVDDIPDFFTEDVPDFFGFGDDGVSGVGPVVDGDDYADLLDSVDGTSGIGPFADGDLFGELVGNVGGSGGGSGSSSGSSGGGGDDDGGFFSDLFSSRNTATILSGLAGVGKQLQQGKINEENLKLAKERLELEKRRLELAERTGKFNAALARRKLEVELALAAIKEAKASVPDRTEELRERRATIQQSAQDSRTKQEAMDRIVARFTNAIK